MVRAEKRKSNRITFSLYQQEQKVSNQLSSKLVTKKNSKHMEPTTIQGAFFHSCYATHSIEFLRIYEELSQHFSSLQESTEKLRHISHRFLETILKNRKS